MTTPVSIHYTNPNAVELLRATPGSSGWDISIPKDHDDIWLDPHHRVLIDVGFSIKIPSPNMEAQIRARSGIASKRGVVPVNEPGTIDSDYRGPVKVCLLNTSDETICLKAGERVAQLVFAPIIQVQLIKDAINSDTQRGVGGFGSTGMIDCAQKPNTRED